MAAFFMRSPGAKAYLLVEAPGEEVSPVLLPLVALPLVLSVLLRAAFLSAFLSDFLLLAGLVAGSLLAAVPLMAAPLSVGWPTGAVPVLPELPDDEDMPAPELPEDMSELPEDEDLLLLGLVAGSLLPAVPLMAAPLSVGWPTGAVPAEDWAKAMDETEAAITNDRFLNVLSVMAWSPCMDSHSWE